MELICLELLTEIHWQHRLETTGQTLCIVLIITLDNYDWAVEMAA